MTTRSKVRQELTSRGKVKYDKVFSNISSFDFTINVSEGLLDYTCLVRRHVNSKSRVGGTVTIPKEPIRGSYFGKCTCGLETRDAVPCEHMAAVVISSRIPLLTREISCRIGGGPIIGRNNFPRRFWLNATFPWRPYARMANQMIRSCIVHLGVHPIRQGGRRRMSEGRQCWRRLT